MGPGGPLAGVLRLLDEDPAGWRVYENTMYHPAGFRIESDYAGPQVVNGRALGWWRRFVLRRAIYRREAVLADAYLTERDRIETERLLAG